MNQASVEMPLTADQEVTVMTVWPTLAATDYGRFWGRIYANKWGFSIFGLPVTVGRILALLSIPMILPLYFHMLIPRLPLVVFGISNPACRKYRLTNLRVIVEQAFGGGEQKSIPLDHFDAIDLEVLAGQEWYPAGELIFRRGTAEAFRLSGVPHPEPFRQTCMKTHAGFLGVQEARQLGQTG